MNFKKTFSNKKNSVFQKKIFDNKAQSGTVFRLMVDAIIGLVILMIILSVLGYFESLRVDISRAEFLSIIKSATESPDGSVISSGVLVFVKGTSFTATQLQSITNYSSDCFVFESNLGFTEIMGGGKIIMIKQNTETKIHVKCVPVSDEKKIECIISFGKKLEEGI